MSVINYNVKELEEKDSARDIESYHDRLIDAISEGLRKRQVENEKKTILLWVLSQQAQLKGYEFNQQYEWLFQNRALLLKSTIDHDCTLGLCTQFNANSGDKLRNVLTNEESIATGDVFVCALTGKIHICPSTPAACNYTVISSRERQEGYVCPVTFRMKSRKQTNVEGYSAERPISKAKFDKQVEDEDNAGNDVEEQNEDGFDVDEDHSDIDDVEGIVGVEDDTQHIGGQTNEYVLDDRDAYMTKVFSKAHRSAKNNGLKHPLPAGKASKPKKVKLTKSIADMNPDEKTNQHLKDLEKKKELANSIVKFVFTFDNQVRLYTSKLNILAEKAVERVNSQKRKAKRSLTTIECDNLFFAYMQDHLPPKPRCTPVLFLGRYTNAIMHMWLTVSHSPYARGIIMAKQKPLKFEKMAFALLYRIAGGGYKVNCSLPDTILQKYALRKVCTGELCERIRNLQITLITHDPAASAAIAESSLLVELRQHSFTLAQPDAKTVNEGYKLLENCYRSIFKELAQQCIEKLQKPSDKREALEAYIDACTGKKIPPTT